MSSWLQRLVEAWRSNKYHSLRVDSECPANLEININEKEYFASKCLFTARTRELALVLVMRLDVPR